MKKASCTQGSLLDMPTPEKKISAKPLPDMQKRMSRLERLIEELCPNGVEYKTLGSICTLITKGTTPKKYTVQGINFIKTESIENSCINKEKLCFIDDQTFSIELKRSILKENDILFAIAGSIGKCAIVASDILPANTNQALAIIRLKNYINNKYIFYVLNSNIMKKYIEYNVKGSAQSNLNLHQMNQFLLPVPPLPVQEEIVRILDTFSELTSKLNSELTSELNKRKQQYQYYREKLLIHDLKDMKKITLGDVGRVSMCKRIMKAETSSEGDVPFYKIGTFGKEPDAYISRKQYEEYKRLYSYPKKGDILISASGTIGRTVIYNGEDAYYQDSNIVWIDNDETKILNKFLYYFYQLQPWSVSDGGTISRLYNDNINRTPIPVPPLEEQERIVSILDRFDALCNDLSSGLPDEIEARKKQYEYYRDKLLTFREAK